MLLSVPGDVHAPIALPGDEKVLASSPALLERAVRLVSTREEPLHPVAKVAGKLDRALKEAFPAAVAMARVRHARRWLTFASGVASVVLGVLLASELTDREHGVLSSNPTWTPR